MRVLVVGGAGYIGSVTAETLLDRAHAVTILDNLSTGHREAVPQDAEFVRGDLGDAEALDVLLARGRFDAAMHFAARSIVPESMTQPGEYFANNVAGVVTLLNRLVRHGVPRLVFSSTAAVYGEPDASPVAESAPVRPNNPYGESKAAVERMLHWYGVAHGLRFAVLRYFNAAGASVARGEDHHPETHLVPLALRAARHEGPGLTVFGSDYPTADGTAVRDYVHVCDLAEAHLLALDRLDATGSLVCNLGSESGYSVRQVVETVRAVTGAPLPVREGPRRPGDSPTTVADAGLARQLLGWTPRRGLDEMIRSAWEWGNRNPNGYVS